MQCTIGYLETVLDEAIEITWTQSSYLRSYTCECPDYFTRQEFRCR